jgi:Fe-S-cluster containining protein
MGDADYVPSSLEMDYSEIDRIFHRDGYQMAHQHLDGRLDGNGLVQAIGHLYDSIDRLLESFLARTARENRRADCTRGCDWCCYQPVYAGTHEILYLRSHILSTFPDEVAGKLAGRARTKSNEVRNSPESERGSLRIACPFLEAGVCRVYEARPMACRIYLSASVDACRRHYGESGDGQTFPDLFEFPLRSGRMMNEGFIAWLRQNGMIVTEWPLEQGYEEIVRSGETPDRWISRERSADGRNKTTGNERNHTGNTEGD